MVLEWNVIGFKWAYFGLDCAQMAPGEALNQSMTCRAK